MKAYEALDISCKLRQAREAKKTLMDAKDRIESEVDNQEQTIEELKAKQRREIATLKLAGGRENYHKVACMLKENVDADTTDIRALYEYAIFAYAQKDFSKGEEYLLRLLRHEDKHNRIALLQNQMGTLYYFLHKYDKAKKYYLMALESFTYLSELDPDANLSNLESVTTNLAILYTDEGDYEKAEEYYQKSLDIYSRLPDRDSDDYKIDFARTLTNIGIFYDSKGDTTKAEEHYLKALENYSQVSD